MKSKIFIISTLLATNLFSNSIDFNMAKKDMKRVAPSNKTQLLSFNSSIKGAMNSVVNISAQRHVTTSSNLPFEMFNDPMLRRFFGDQFGEQFKQNKIQRSLGSGVILSKDGYIVTNNHVIENAEKISVTIGTNPTEYNAKIIGRDPDSDLAVIKIEGNTFHPIKIGYSKDLQIGDVIFALGNPFGIGITVTQGIVSALNKDSLHINRYENFIQTDASINPGNSGGALIDSRGALIGINSAIITRNDGNLGVGFAIPISMVKNVVQNLIKNGKVTRGYLGVVIVDLTPNLLKVYNHKKGALITDVSPNTPAKKYGLERGDLIFAVNNIPIRDRRDLQNTIASFKPNQKITLNIERDRKNYNFNIVLTNRDGLIVSSSNNGYFLGGLELSELTPRLVSKYRISGNISGVLVTKVKPNSRAEKAGFQAGDIIIQIEHMKIKSFVNIQQALRKYNNKHKRIYVNRYGQTILLAIK